MTVRNLPIEPLRFDGVAEINIFNGQVLRRRGIDSCQVVTSKAAEYFKRATKGNRCIYCGAKLKTADESLAGGVDLAVQSASFFKVCNDCGAWRREEHSTISLPLYYVPTAKTFSLELNYRPSIARLSTEIAKDPTAIFSMSPERFEVFVGSIMSECLDCTVQHVGRTGDNGVDLIALRGEKPLLIQVKRRTHKDAVENIETVKLMFASTLLGGAKDGMVVTSAKRFTAGAKRVAQSASLFDRHFKLDLVSMGELLKICGAVAERQGPHPYTQYAAKGDAERAEREANGEMLGDVAGPILLYPVEQSGGLASVVKTTTGYCHVTFDFSEAETFEIWLSDKECGCDSFPGLCATLRSQATYRTRFGLDSGIRASLSLGQPAYQSIRVLEKCLRQREGETLLEDLD